MKKLLLLLLIVGAAGGGLYYASRKPEPERSFITAVITRGDITQTVSATGSLQAVNTVEVGTQVSGTIRELFADYNSVVTKGQVIAVIDSTLFEAERDRAKADLDASRAAVAEARANVDDALRTYRRKVTLYERDFIAASEVDDAQRSVATTRARLASAQAAVAQAEATLRRAEANLGYTRIVAPVNGVVVGKNISAGQTVAASYQTPTLFTIAEDLTQMQVEAAVDEADIGYLGEGMKASFSVDAYPEELFKGYVHQIRLEPSSSEHVVTYTTIIRVGNPERKLKPGMTANVEIETATASDVLKVPAAALRFVPPEPAEEGKEKAAKTPQLWTKELRPIAVETGLSDGSHTEISGDVEEGMEVVTAVIDSEGSGGRNRRPF